MADRHDSDSDSDSDGGVNNVDSAPIDPMMGVHAVRAARPDLSQLGVIGTTRLYLVRNPSFQMPHGGACIAGAGMFLGAVMGCAVTCLILVSNATIRQFTIWAMMMAVFHSMEFLWTAVFHPFKLSANAFLLNHSRAYHIALLAGVVEFLIESFLFPSFKRSTIGEVVSWVGLLLVIGGQAVRSISMFTAASNFTHQVAETKQPNHQLITHGIYAICRHPSYAGWFWWSVGTQLLLCNPLCTVAYAMASYKFFKKRIHYEESAMFEFFGAAYTRYQHQVPSGVPFVKGFGLE